ncbi:MFS transporter [Brevibacterium sp. UCMA 11752]|uniref:MFS transporter n=1 Tax=Brevibacterium sp. UCMA 11752 TaxID=2745946 RepID=UPI001F44B10C|nr:MFS transporter [Brevibacterium sp. UCMA 11752]MCF2587768.1 MFS transporter [Brevibacterium sp. UCMA 11752]
MNSQTAVTKQRRAASPGRARWWILGWLLAAMMINYMDRSSLSIAAPHMIDELGLTAADIGLLGTAFSLTYAFFQLPGGWLTDRLGAKPVYVIALGFWSIATSLMAFGHHMWHFMISRILLGVFEAPVSPTSAKIVSEWFPPRERGAAVGVYDSGSKWGPAVAPPILTFLILGFGWRAMFVILGVLGIIVAIGFWVFYRSPEHDRRVSAAELEHIRAREEDDNAPTGHIPWLRLFTKPQTWAMVLGFVAVVWTLNIFVTFLPLMLNDIYSVADEALGWYTAIPFAVGGIGGILGGWFTTKYSRMRSYLAPLACKRRIAAVYGGALAICSILVGVTTGHFALQLAAMSLALFFCGALSAVGWSIPADVVTGSRVASLGSIQNFGGYFAGSLSPWLTGVLVTTTGSYLIPFVVGAVVAVIAGIAYLLLLRAPIRLDSTATEIGDTSS